MSEAEARKQEADGIRTAVRIILEGQPGAALNACREDEPDIVDALAKHDAALREAYNADLIAASLDFDEERAELLQRIAELESK